MVDNHQNWAKKMSANLMEQNKSGRIQYIDALRGFTMILVVFAHVETFSFFNFSYETFLGKFFQSFRMPLFFFISGFIAFSANREWTGNVVRELTKKKMLVQIIPALFFGLLYTYACLNSDFNGFISDPTKKGYWFTFVLLEMFLLYYALSWGGKVLGKRFRMSTSWLTDVSLIVSAGVLFILKLPFKQIPVLDIIGNYTSCHYTFNYFIFFVFGVLVRKYAAWFENILNNRFFSAFAVIMFASVFYIGFQVGNAVNQTDVFWKVTMTLIETIAAFFGIFVVYSYFKKYSSAFDYSSRLGKALQFIGRRTLDIYLLHYFFLPKLPEVGSFLISSSNLIIELFVGFGLSLMIIAVCLCISNVIRISPFLGKYLFGAK